MLKKLIKEFLLVVLIGIVISPAQWLTKLYFENYKYYGISVVWKDYDGTFLYVVLISIIIFTVINLTKKLIKIDKEAP